LDVVGLVLVDVVELGEQRLLGLTTMVVLVLGEEVVGVHLEETPQRRQVELAVPLYPGLR